MNISEIINIVFIILTIIAGFLATYFKTNVKLNSTVTKFISDAENMYKDTISGGQKFSIVVGKLYNMIPAFIRPFIPQSILAALVQNIFNQVDAYAQQQLNKVIDKIPTVVDNSKVVK
jgi:hypothetical protein